MLFAEVGGAVKRPGEASLPRHACGHQIDPEHDSCQICDIPTHAFAVVAPWDTLPIPESGLFLGRAPKFSRYADRLAAHLNVSGEHAILRPVATGVEVVDCSSTNGTFVNDVRVSPERPVIAPANAIVRLGTDPPLELRVVET
jgi:hypothetical protein